MLKLLQKNQFPSPNKVCKEEPLEVSKEESGNLSLIVNLIASIRFMLGNRDFKGYNLGRVS